MRFFRLITILEGKVSLITGMLIDIVNFSLPEMKIPLFYVDWVPILRHKGYILPVNRQVVKQKA